MSSYLHQLIAVEPTVKADAQSAVTATREAFAHPELFQGQTRTYQTRLEDGDHYPDERANPQFDAADVLGSLQTALVRLFDLTAQKEWTDQTARADLDVDGQTLFEDVPVTYLLFLDKQLAQLLDLIDRLPLLDPSEDWRPDGVSGMERSMPRKTVRTHRVPKAHVLYPATPEHPAQVQAYTVDEPEGEWTTIRFSTAVTVDRQRTLRERVRRLQEAVRVAREEGNRAEVILVQPGRRILDWVFTDG